MMAYQNAHNGVAPTRYIIASYEDTIGLEDGEYVTYWQAYDAESNRILPRTWSWSHGDTLDLAQRHYPDALHVGTLIPVTGGDRR